MCECRPSRCSAGGGHSGSTRPKSCLRTAWCVVRMPTNHHCVHSPVSEHTPVSQRAHVGCLAAWLPSCLRACLPACLLACLPSLVVRQLLHCRPASTGRPAPSTAESSRSTSSACAIDQSIHYVHSCMRVHRAEVGEITMLWGTHSRAHSKQRRQSSRRLEAAAKENKRGMWSLGADLETAAEFKKRVKTGG